MRTLRPGPAIRPISPIHPIRFARDAEGEVQHVANDLRRTTRGVPVARRNESFSDLARRALARETEEHEVDFARMAAPYRGMLKGPSDLSSREGYGNKNDR